MKRTRGAGAASGGVWAGLLCDRSPEPEPGASQARQIKVWKRLCPLSLRHSCIGLWHGPLLEPVHSSYPPHSRYMCGLSVHPQDASLGQGRQLESVECCAQFGSANPGVDTLLDWPRNVRIGIRTGLEQAGGQTGRGESVGEGQGQGQGQGLRLPGTAVVQPSPAPIPAGSP